MPAGLTTGGQFTRDGTNGGVPTGWGGEPKDFQRHYDSHAKDFGVQTPKEYVDKARNFYQKFLDEKLPAVENTSGYAKIYDPQTNTFGVYSPDGDPTTFYKRTSPTYFDRQIEKVLDGGGKIVNPYPSESGGGGGGGGWMPGGRPGDMTHHPWDIEE